MTETQKLREEIAELHKRVEQLESSAAASQSAFVVLIRYLAQGEQIYIQELCTDLDSLCAAQSDENWQRNLMALTEILRSVDERLTSRR